MSTVTQAVEALVRATVSLSDEDMGRPWVWGRYDEEGVRFALLMTHHELRDLAVRLEALRETPTPQAARILAQYHQSYRDMTAVLATVRDGDLDRAPAKDEWPVREVCAHMLGAEYGFLGVCRFALDRRRSGNDQEPSDDEWNAFAKPRGEERKAVLAALEHGSVEDVRNDFATIHLRILRELGDITDAEVDAPSWFWDGAMPLRFRLHRFEEHLRQHTIQLDKTQVGIGRAPTEAHRLVRNIYNALADVETARVPAPELRDAAAREIESRAHGLAGESASRRA